MRSTQLKGFAFNTSGSTGKKGKASLKGSQAHSLVLANKLASDTVRVKVSLPKLKFLEKPLEDEAA